MMLRLVVERTWAFAILTTVDVYEDLTRVEFMPFSVHETRNR